MTCTWHRLKWNFTEDASFPPVLPTVASRLGGCQLSWARTSQTQLQGSFQWKTHWWSEISHWQSHRQLRETHFPSLGRQMLHAISPPAKGCGNEEEEIDSGPNKPWAQEGIPKQPVLFKEQIFFLVWQNYILAIICSYEPQFIQVCAHSSIFLFIFSIKQKHKFSCDW